MKQMLISKITTVLAAAVLVGCGNSAAPDTENQSALYTQTGSEGAENAA